MKLCLNCASDELVRDFFPDGYRYICKECQESHDPEDIHDFELFFAGYTYAVRGNTVEDLPRIDKKTALSKFKRTKL